MKFRKGGQIHPRDKLYYNKQPITYQNSFIYLGIVFSTKQSLESHLHHLKWKSVKALNRLHAKVNLRKVRYKAADRLLDSIIKPTATYGTQVFNLLDDEGVVEYDVEYVGQDFPETYFVEEDGAYEIIEVQDLPPHLRGTIV